MSENNENGNNGFYAEGLDCSRGSCTWPEIGGAPPGLCDYLVPEVKDEKWNGFVILNLA